MRERAARWLITCSCGVRVEGHVRVHVAAALV
jgi:hypothetical protein